MGTAAPKKGWQRAQVLLEMVKIAVPNSKPHAREKSGEVLNFYKRIKKAQCQHFYLPDLCRAPKGRLFI